MHKSKEAQTDAIEKQLHNCNISDYFEVFPYRQNFKVTTGFIKLESSNTVTQNTRQNVGSVVLPFLEMFIISNLHV